jgi:spermidine synthase
MNPSTLGVRTGLPASRPFLLALLLLFAGSGCAALIYEIVWLQLLQLLIGSTAVSLGVLLGTFMGGMCAGSLALPRVVAARHHPVRVFACIEMGIGVFGILVYFGMPYVHRLYTAGAGEGWPDLLMRGLVSAVCLLPPTLLMGASLPAMARWMETTPQGVSWLGLFYFGNLAGAVFGCLLAGFYLLRVHDALAATVVAAAINATVAAAGLLLAAATHHHAADELPPESAPATAAPAVFIAIALSGLSALGAEVIWTRVLSLMLGATVYTFSIILAVFLTGLGIGSSAGSFLSRRLADPKAAFGWCQMLLALLIASAAYLLAGPLPYWRIGATLQASPWPRFAFDTLRCLCAVLPAACCWGASFPLALAAAARRGQDPGRLAGRVYAANTAGAILGALGFSLVFLPGLGSQQCQRLLIALATAAALILLAARWRPQAALPLAASLSMVALLAWDVPAVPWGVVAYGRRLPAIRRNVRLLYQGEGRNASVAITAIDETRYFHVSGKIEASSGPEDLRLEQMLGHIPALLHPRPRSALVVGCGAGVTAGTFVLHPAVERIVVCEIEPLIPAAADRYFARENHGVVRDPRTRIITDDARHYILKTRDRFDIITSDPIHPWVKGSAALYTEEYFSVVKDHLNPGGFVTQWVPLYESNLETVRSELATFFQVFPNGTIWSNESAFGEGFDLVLLGQAEPTRIDVDRLARRLDSEQYARVAEALRVSGFRSALGLLSTYAARAEDLGRWLRNAQINRDRGLRLQYLAGLGLNLQRAEPIYREMLRYRRWPDGLFLVSSASQARLRKALGFGAGGS